MLHAYKNQMKICDLHNVVIRIDNGEDPKIVLEETAQSTGVRIDNIVSKIHVASRTRPDWLSASQRIQQVRGLKSRNGKTGKDVNVPRAKSTRKLIVNLLERHPAGLSTTHLRVAFNIDRATLAGYMAPLIREGIVQEPRVVSGRPTIWRLCDNKSNDSVR